MKASNSGSLALLGVGVEAWAVMMTLSSNASGSREKHWYSGSGSKNNKDNLESSATKVSFSLLEDVRPGRSWIVNVMPFIFGSCSWRAGDSLIDEV